MASGFAALSSGIPCSRFRTGTSIFLPVSVYGIASGRAPSEAAYTMQKFIRAGFGTNQIDNCSRA